MNTIDSPTITCDDVTVGDFFYESWGYDQTNVDFFKVVKRTPKGVYVQEWAHAPALGDEVIPGDGPRLWPAWDKGSREPVFNEDGTRKMIASKPEFHRLRPGYRGQPSLAWKSFADLHFWTYTPKYVTPLGYGH